VITTGVTLPLALPPLERYPWIDRGAYAWGYIADLAALAPLARYVDAPFACARVLVLGPGDYILAHHDPMPEVDVVPQELVLDLSPAPVPGAELYYRRRGAAFLAVPVVPGTLAVVERGPTITANHTYVSRRYPDARVVRLVARTKPRM